MTSAGRPASVRPPSVRGPAIGHPKRIAGPAPASSVAVAAVAAGDASISGWTSRRGPSNVISVEPFWSVRKARAPWAASRPSVTRLG